MSMLASPHAPYVPSCCNLNPPAEACFQEGGAFFIANTAKTIAVFFKPKTAAAPTTSELASIRDAVTDAA